MGGFSIFSSKESGVAETTTAFYEQSVWGIMGSISNSGGPSPNDNDPTPSPGGSFIKSTVVNKGLCCARVRISCTVRFDAIKFGSPQATPWDAQGRLLGDQLKKTDTTHYSFSGAAYGFTYMTQFDTMNKTTVKIVDLKPQKPFELYYLTPAVVMQCSGALNGGFSEGAQGSCTVTYLSVCSGK